MHGLSDSDIRKVASSCFRASHFDDEGEVLCQHEVAWGDCRKEYLCDQMAALILVPRVPCGPELFQAAIHGVEPWVIRFRKAMECPSATV